METPEPPGRVRTPPAPRLGALYDDYEPYSPKHSKRTHAAQDADHSPSAEAHRRLSDKRTHTVTSTPRRSAPSKRQQSSQTLSPPPSPVSSARKSRTAPEPRHFIDRTEARPAPKDRTSMFPTPERTPAKHKITSQAPARTLNLRAHLPHERLPTPRRQRIRNTLDDIESAPAPVAVHTDSRDRIPDMDNSDNNPFVGPRKRPTTRAQQRYHNGEEKQMDDRVRRDEGFIYNFRGHKIFRAFTDEANQRTPLHNLQTQSARLAHYAGESAHRPLTRSTLQPRLLWPEASAAQTEEEEDQADEEGQEETVATTGADDEVASQEEEADEQAQDETPVIDSTSSAAEVEESPLIHIPAAQKKAKKPSPFDSWPRKKSGAVAPTTTKKEPQSQQGKKRGSEGLGERASGAKRTRSGAVAR